MNNEMEAKEKVGVKFILSPKLWGEIRTGNWGKLDIINHHFFNVANHKFDKEGCSFDGVGCSVSVLIEKSDDQ